jgi:putative holliday junction resolvase
MQTGPKFIHRGEGMKKGFKRKCPVFFYLCKSLLLCGKTLFPMNHLGLDYGEKRIGLAFGDGIGVAVPLDAAVEATPEERMTHIAQVVAQRRIAHLVVGYPYNMDGTVGFKAREVDVFIAALEQRVRLPVDRVDETLTSHEVESRAGKRRKGVKAEKKARARGTVDSSAAALILQDYLDSIQGDFPES